MMKLIQIQVKEMVDALFAESAFSGSKYFLELHPVNTRAEAKSMVVETLEFNKLFTILPLS